MSNDEPVFLEIGKTYIEKDQGGLPVGSMFKYIGVVERADAEKEHEFQCLEFDCDDIYQHYAITTSEASFRDWFHKQ